MSDLLRRATRRVGSSPTPLFASPTASLSSPINPLTDRAASREERHLLLNHALISQNHITLVHHHDRILAAVEELNRAQSWLQVFSAALLAQLIFFLIVALTTLKWSDATRLFRALQAVTGGEEEAWMPMFESLAGMFRVPRFSEGLLVYLAALTLAVSAVGFAAKHPQSSFLLVVVGIAVVAALWPHQTAAVAKGAAREVVKEVHEVVSTERNPARGTPLTHEAEWTPVGHHDVTGTGYGRY